MGTIISILFIILTILGTSFLCLLNWTKQEEKIMSFEKAIEHGKEKRKPYYGSKRVDPTCRNHGSCPYCAKGREYSSNKRKEKLKDMVSEYERNH
jgi:hypothetical protein